MNLSNKSFRTALFLGAVFLGQCPCNSGFAKNALNLPSLQIQKSLKRKSGPQSSAKQKISLVWQIIRSQGQGDKMGTSADTFIANGELIQSEANRWNLRIGGSSTNVSFRPNGPGGDGVVYVEREDLLKLLDINLWNADGANENDPNFLAAKSGTLLLFISKNQNRQQDVIYRSPEEELFLVKASLVSSN